MKKMTCRELGGACDMEFLAETLEEMGNKSKEHVMQINDEAHNKSMEEMKVMMAKGEDKKWMEDMQKKFDAAPEA